MDVEQSALNPSSILDLKAELYKKYESFRKAKLAQTSELPKPSRFKNKNESNVKDNKHTILVQPKEDNEEHLALQKSRLALEAKAKLYEKITSSSSLIDDEENEHYLVDFQRKVLYNPPETEKCGKNETTSNDNNTQNILTGCGSDTVIDQATKMQTVSKNTNLIEDMDVGQPVHYQNIQYNEIRDHGTAYFAFSTDETERKEQMEELNALRQDTEEQRMIKQRMLRKRKSMLQSRLAKVCERRNIDKNVVGAYTSVPNSNDCVDYVSSSNTVDLDSIPLPNDAPEVSEKKEQKIRPWDIGKPDLHLLASTKRKIMSQNQWVEEKRSDRPSEFAPPSFY